MSDNQKIIIAAAIGFVIGFGLCWIWDGGNKEAEDATETNATTSVKATNATNTKATNTKATNIKNETVSVSTVKTDNSISVKNQIPGKTVSIEKLVLKDGGWVAIYEDFQGPTQRILGAQKFAKGETTGLVTLLRTTVEGKMYQAVLLTDNGDGKFDHRAGDNVITVNGAPVTAKFTATVK